MWRIRLCVAWTVFVWLVLIKNMVTDNQHNWQFRAVHIALALVSLAIAGSIWPLAKRVRPRS